MVAAPTKSDVPAKWVIQNPVNVDGVSKAKPCRAPELGEHTREVLAELGYDRVAIENLAAGGAI
jgi:formyl-CoA transferase